MDSYDELKNEVIGTNLTHTNKIFEKFPTCKIIYTARTEALISSQNYYTWFQRKGETNYKEVRIDKFNYT